MPHCRVTSVKVVRTRAQRDVVRITRACLNGLAYVAKACPYDVEMTRRPRARDQSGTPTIAPFEFSMAPVSYSAMRDRARLDFAGLRAAKSVIRVTPLLSVTGPVGRRSVAVGRTRVVVSGRCQAAFEITIVATWQESGSIGAFELVDHSANDADLRREVEALLPIAEVALPGSSNEGRAAQLAKELCESSRGAVAALRDIRYALENQLASTSLGSSATAEHTSVVAGLLQLNIMCARAADQSRELSREGLWVYLSDNRAYHSYRKLQDPSLLSLYPAATRRLRPWMRLHDTAIRHCLEMRKQLDAESESIRSLIAAASSILSAKDADAQSRFNVLAAIASVGIGLPALVLSLYGADILLPMNTGPRQLAFAPVALALLIAALIAMWQGVRLKRGKIWTAGAVGIVLVLLALLLAAGLLAPGRT